MRNVIGICNLHDNPKLGLLTENHPSGAVSFLGRYALMDFTLSNFSNSGINKVCILVNNNFRSITSHIRSGVTWVDNTKTGFQKVYVNEKGLVNPKFNTDIKNLNANISSFDEIQADYVVVAPTFFIMSCDFRPFVDAHVASGADVSVIYRHASDAIKNYQNCDELIIGDNNQVNDVINFAGNKETADISLETFVINRSTFKKILDTVDDVSSMYGLREMLKYYLGKKEIKLNAYKFDGYVAPMLSLEDYVRHSFELLDYSNRSQLFLPNWPIYTTTHNTVPSLYGPHSDVKNSFIANGSIIKGVVRNSIICRDVIIEEGAVIENSILFTKTKVDKDIHVNHVLADKNVLISECKEIKEKDGKVLYISQGVKL